ncbi:MULTISPECIES: NAD(P)/FAD-dependent oxidoreductase [Cupriavidus]|uniref:FAD-dependent pyridine nucleotide-disulfide oxidoreductase:HI0933-like protein n=1 Tax=Cupriavidus pinatubonensis (strain JMP 134 / LMG 1197) TaxID=264198 RepID=Q46UP9_CUPPJ|nr:MULTISPECIES: FAD-dependent oxidoreductase [Cupriavidus]TPQ33295.1 ferredoxin reductase [Cupriavidus pinatubonensis]
MSTQTPILIIGAGQAGAMAAAELRKLGHAERIVMVGGERHAPYERPPLSKAVLADASQQGQVGVHPAGFYAERDIELRLCTTVSAIDAARSVATCTDGSEIRFDACLLATGGRARTLPHLPAGTPNVHYLRTLDDAARLREAMQGADEVLVIGGGFLGLETASTAVDLGLKVTILESADRLLARAAPAELSDWLAQRVRARGVDLRLGCRITAIEPQAQGVQVRLADGTTWHIPVLVVAIGLTPNTELAAIAGLALHPGNGGIQIDEQGRTSVPNIYAAGDCASQFQPLFGAEMRMESWQSANEQARIAATSMLGLQAALAATPWFWTDQFGCNVQMLGAALPGMRYVWRDMPASGAASPKSMLLGTLDGCLRHAIAVNAGGDLRQLRSLFDLPVNEHLARLCDAALPLRQIVREVQAEISSRTASLTTN